MLSFEGFSMGGHTTCIDDSPPSLSSFDMFKKCALDDATKLKELQFFKNCNEKNKMQEDKAKQRGKIMHMKKNGPRRCFNKHSQNNLCLKEPNC
jgi:hypothetical protein